MSKSTMVELVTELEKLSPSDGKDKMIKLAKEGGFHDFRSKSVCGKMYFLECGKWCKSHMIEADCKIIDRLEKDIKEGEYDEIMTEADRQFVLNDIKNDTSLSEKDRVFATKMFNQPVQPQAGV